MNAETADAAMGVATMDVATMDVALAGIAPASVPASMPVWSAVVTWAPIGAAETGDVTVARRPCREQARLAGRHSACCSGAVSVEVRSPDGTLVEVWDRTSNIWQVLRPAAA